MPATYSLDTKIEALNLLDQLDDDFQRVKDRLQDPAQDLKGLALQRNPNSEAVSKDRQYRHFANIKLELLTDMFETSRDIMKKIKSGEHGGIGVSQLAYVLNTLLHHSKQLEQNFQDRAPDAQMETEQPNRIRFIDEHNLWMPRPCRLKFLKSPARLNLLACGRR